MNSVGRHVVEIGAHPEWDWCRERAFRPHELRLLGHELNGLPMPMSYLLGVLSVSGLSRSRHPCPK